MIKLVIDNHNEIYIELERIKSSEIKDFNRLHDLVKPYFTYMLDSSIDDAEKQEVLDKIYSEFDSKISEIYSNPAEFYIWSGRIASGIVVNSCREAINTSYMFSEVPTELDISNVCEKLSMDSEFNKIYDGYNFIDNMDTINSIFFDKPYYYRLIVQQYFFMDKDKINIADLFGIQEVIIKNVIASARDIFVSSIHGVEVTQSNIIDEDGNVDKSGVDIYDGNYNQQSIINNNNIVNELEMSVDNSINKQDSSVDKPKPVSKVGTILKYSGIVAVLAMLAVLSFLGYKKYIVKDGNKKGDNNATITDVVEVNNGKEDLTEKNDNKTGVETEEKSTEQVKVTEEEEKIQPEKKEPTEYDILLTFVKEQLIPAYGFCSTRNQDNKNATETNWLQLKGVASAKIDDYDGDGHLELLVVRFAEEDLPDYNKIMVTLFYVENNQVALGGEIDGLHFFPGGDINTLADSTYDRFGFECNKQYAYSVRIATVESDYVGKGLYIQFVPGILKSEVYEHQYVYRISDNKFDLLWTNFGTVGEDYTYVFEDGNVIQHDFYNSGDYRPINYNMDYIGLEEDRGLTWDLFPKSCRGKEIFWGELNGDYVNNPSGIVYNMYYNMKDYTDMRTILDYKEPPADESATSPEKSRFPLSDDEILNLSLDHYCRKNNVGCSAMIMGYDGDIVNVKIFDDMGTHTAAREWYYIDRNTGEGTTMFSNEHINLLE